MLAEFPFSAVIGQHALKLALLLNAVNPKIGGVLISGPRGNAKSTLARGLAALLPATDEHPEPPFINLPLGASEERLTGSLDIQQVLEQQQVTFQPGLLAQADGGVLYVDEVNLLQDALVDLLLDAAARGINVVERDGISRSHAARFTLIGTMNPEEGELRPQLLDRFGLCIELDSRPTLSERIAIVQQREAFDSDPDAYLQSCHAQTDSLRAQIQRARQQLAKVHVPEWVYEWIAQACDTAGVEGMRADVTWHRAAKAHAAWLGRHEVTEEDLRTVEPWVLQHRRTENDTNPPSQNQPNPNPSPRNPESSSANDRTSNAKPQNNNGDWGAMPAQSQLVEPTEQPIVISSLPSSGSTYRSERDNSSKRVGQSAQRTMRGNAASATTHIDWFQSIVANRGRSPLTQLVYQSSRNSAQAVHLILLDTSASTLGRKAFGVAKGVLEQISHQAYRLREQIAVIGFGNGTVQPLLSRRRAPGVLPPLLKQLGAGGGTPLRDGVQFAVKEMSRWVRQEPDLTLCTYLITDGRTRQQLNDLTLGDQCVVIDTEQGAVKRGQAKRLAQELGAQYLRC